MEEILNGKLHFLRSVHNVSNIVGDSASSVNYGKKGTRKHKQASKGVYQGTEKQKGIDLEKFSLDIAEGYSEM